jgi:hypothetical protein
MRELFALGERGWTQICEINCDQRLSALICGATLQFGTGQNPAVYPRSSAALV